MRATIARLQASHDVHPIFYAGPVAMLGVAVAYCARTGVPLHDLLRDHSWVTQSPIHVGVVSILGVLIWSAGAAVCLFSGLLLRLAPGRREDAGFLLSAGALTTLLALDDLFLFHETLFPGYLGIAEKATLLAYAGATAWLLVRYRRRILSLAPAGLAVALGLFTLSLGVDLFQYAIEGVIGDLRILLEDGGKFLGIAAWSGYFITAAGRLLLPSRAVDAPGRLA